MLLEAEKQNLETELEVTHKELSVLKMKLQKASSALENSVSRVEHTTTIDKLKWYVKKKKKHIHIRINNVQNSNRYFVSSGIIWPVKMILLKWCIHPFYQLLIYHLVQVREFTAWRDTVVVLWSAERIREWAQTTNITHNDSNVLLLSPETILLPLEQEEKHLGTVLQQVLWRLVASWILLNIRIF